MIDEHMKHIQAKLHFKFAIDRLEDIDFIVNKGIEFAGITLTLSPGQGVRISSWSPKFFSLGTWSPQEPGNFFSFVFDTNATNKEIDNLRNRSS